MALSVIQLQPFTNVVASGTAITDLRHLLGMNIERITLALGGTFTKSMITAWQLKANGKVILDSTGSRTDSRMQWRGITAAAGFLTIDFLEVRAKTLAGVLAGSLDTTFGVQDLRLEVTISGATSPTLAGFAEVSNPIEQQDLQLIRPLIARVHYATQTIGAAGTFALAIPHFDPNSGGSLFKRIAIFSSSITGARVERNGVREWEHVTAAANNFNAGEYQRTNQAGLFMLDFIQDGFFQDRLLDTRPAAKTNTANLFATFSGAETVTIEVETLEPLAVY